MIIIYSIAAIGTTSSAIITFYRWIYLPKKEKQERIKNIFIRPILEIIPQIRERIENYDIPNLDPISQIINDHSSEVPLEIIQVKKHIDYTVETYRNWLNDVNKFIRNSIWYFVYRNGTINNRLAEEFEKIGQGQLGHLLSNHLTMPILEGKDITKSLFNDIMPDKIIEAIKKCKNSKDVNDIIKLINNLKDYQCLKEFRKEREDTLYVIERIRINLRGLQIKYTKNKDRKKAVNIAFG